MVLWSSARSFPAFPATSVASAHTLSYLPPLHSLFCCLLLRLLLFSIFCDFHSFPTYKFHIKNEVVYLCHVCQLIVPFQLPDVGAFGLRSRIARGLVASGHLVGERRRRQWQRYKSSTLRYVREDIA